ncbi:hypothetical protein, partial [Pseudooceanicola sediminis]|uniref:hypothetical protein n=1 Tax=Pseudooceanicola sediminis TaxID=2211117 RepID=UPI001F20F508
MAAVCTGGPYAATALRLRGATGGRVPDRGRLTGSGATAGAVCAARTLFAGLSGGSATPGQRHASGRAPLVGGTSAASQVAG